ncbi:helix-turn-helix domain-containing protein [Cloacibacillus evryensis]|uniref:helix-turn-helix transcriptional regulator n=1 Tax=Cloacibacillus evryensis TaxID=508460 RepID=UPI000453003B|nr:helix-turn-helix domain-containing protein [Cloacibacillus evryensis]EXG78625.1 putative transcriptional regulator [Cloacibacillus evryensis DSM 19522]MCQ4764523.1 helix-turn-helix domain-containing protein [Cloacibacillus evryensis]
MIGKEIIVRRKRMSLTQRELARLINVKSTTMHQYEVGLRKIPLEALGNIAKILQCSPEDLAFEEFGLPAPSETTAGDSEIKGSANDDGGKLIFADPLDNEIVALLKDLDQIAKEKVITYMRDQKVITGYYRAVRERR